MYFFIGLITPKANEDICKISVANCCVLIAKSPLVLKMSCKYPDNVFASQSFRSTGQKVNNGEIIIKDNNMPTLIGVSLPSLLAW